MNKIYILILTTLCLTTLHSQQPVQKFMGLQGQVKSVTQTLYSAIEKDGQIVAGEKGDFSFPSRGVDMVFILNREITNSRIRFNREGWVTNRKEGWSRINYTYDKNNSLTEIEEHFVYMSYLTLINRSKNEEEWQRMTSASSANLYSYISKVWNPTTRTLQISQTEITENRPHAIQQRGKMKKNVVGKYKYDPQGRMIESFEAGNRLQSVYIVYTYNDRNEEIQRDFYEDEKKKKYLSCITYTYTQHDEKGNWTECVAYIGSQPIMFIKRDYSYF